MGFFALSFCKSIPVLPRLKCSTHCSYLTWPLPPPASAALRHGRCLKTLLGGFSILPGAAGGCCPPFPKTPGCRGRGGQAGRQRGVAPCAHVCPCATGLARLRKVLPVPFLLFMKSPPAALHPCLEGGWKWDEAQGSSPVCPPAALARLGQGGGHEDGRWGGGLGWGDLTPLCLRTEPAKDGSVPLLAPNLRIQS